MPLYSIYALDKTGDGPAIRAANRPAHLAWAAGFAPAIRMAGPLLSEDGTRMVGSTFVLEMESLEAVKALAQEDPYAKAGLFAEVHIRPVKWLLGEGKPAHA